jgi:protein-tyrosine phosphatase
MIDIHSHILWGIDDGATSLDDSLAMLRAAAAAGTTDIVATPHANSRYQFDPATIAMRIEELRAHHPGLPHIHSGCDFHVSALNIEDALLNPTKYTINSGQYLLVELPEMFSPASITHILRRLLDEGMLPIVTHPERNPVLQESLEIVDRWIGEGCLIQITAQSLKGRFGQLAKRVALSCLRTGRAHFIASDAHDVIDRPPRLDGIADVLQKEIGESLTRRLLVENPQAVIQNLEGFIDTRVFPKVRRWPRLWRR